MEILEIEWKNKKQKSVVFELLKELNIDFRSIQSTKNQEYNLYGKGFQKSILDAKKSYEDGDKSQFTEISKEDLWK